MSSDAEYIGVPLPWKDYPDEFCRIGGVPKSMAPERWPMCGQCGQPLDFYFALDLQDPKPIAKKYRYAFFFFCDVTNGTCSPYYPWGANRIVLLRDLDATSPTKHLGPHKYHRYAVGFCEKREWEQRKKEERQAFTDALLNPKFDADGMVHVPMPRLGDTPETFHLLNEPAWIQNDETPTCPKCEGPVRFIGQIESTYDRKGKGFPFGVAYAFLCAKECCEDGHYLMYQVD